MASFTHLQTDIPEPNGSEGGEPVKCNCSSADDLRQRLRVALAETLGMPSTPEISLDDGDMM